MNAIAINMMTPADGMSATPIPSRPAVRFWANTLDEVAALVMPEQITAKAIRNVMKCTPNALWL